MRRVGAWAWVAVLGASPLSAQTDRDAELRSSVDLLDVLSELSERAVALTGGTHGLVVLHEPEAARGVRWNDPLVRDAWPFEPRIVSRRDLEFADVA